MSQLEQFLKLFEEDDVDGEPAGSLELLATNLNAARKYAQAQFGHYKRNLDVELPNFNDNFIYCQQAAKKGWMARKDMPVIKTSDVRDLQQRLADGYIDINAPRSDVVGGGNPFPAGLTGRLAKLWLKGGLKKFDGKTKDDIIPTRMVRTRANALQPIQSQIYLDKAIEAIARKGRDGALSKIDRSILVLGSNLEILDGHHRWLMACLIDTDTPLKGLMVDLPLGTLLPLSIAYADAIGNRRNA
jgi:hypothetical protein